MTAFSERLISLREARGWSKTYVANHLGLKNMQTYANYEYGRREPDLETTAKLANLFNVSTDYLLGRKTLDNNDIDLDRAIDNAMSFDGKPVTEHDRKMMKQLWKAYMAGKE